MYVYESMSRSNHLLLLMNFCTFITFILHIYNIYNVYIYII